MSHILDDLQIIAPLNVPMLKYFYEKVSNNFGHENRMKQKRFTLIEFLVVVVIIGIQSIKPFSLRIASISDEVASRSILIFFPSQTMNLFFAKREHFSLRLRYFFTYF